MLEKLKVLARKEKKLKEYRRRLRIKGRIIKKQATKSGNIKITIKKDEDACSFIVIKTHKERYKLAEKLSLGKAVSVEGIPKFRMTICTRLKVFGEGDLGWEAGEVGGLDNNICITNKSYSIIFGIIILIKVFIH